MDLAGKRVAVIGTGPTAVQLITEIAKEVSQLTVFQRTPNYCAPLRNGPVSPETQRQFKENAQEIHKRIRESPFGFDYTFDMRNTFDVPREERLDRYEELWAKPGFSKWLANFHDIMTNREANEDFAEFVRNKIRARVKDPVVAEKLVPKDHPFGSKRIPLESGYYEQFNRPNVLLVDVRETPIERINPTGIKTSDKQYDFDIIIYATGFDAVSGSLTRMDIRGENGESFKDRWADGPRSYLNLQTAGFPNFFMAINSAFCNYPVCAEMVVEWITDCIKYIRDKGYSRIQPTEKAEEAWIEHTHEMASKTLLSDAKSWFMGSNIPGKKRALLLYANAAPAYKKYVSGCRSQRLRRVRAAITLRAGLANLNVVAGPIYRAGHNNFRPRHPIGWRLPLTRRRRGSADDQISLPYQYKRDELRQVARVLQDARLQSRPGYRRGAE